MNALIDQLRQLVGDGNVLCDGDLSAWEQDWRKRSRGKALAVVRPGSTAEVAQVVQGLRRGAARPSCRRAATPGWWSGPRPTTSGTQVVLSLQRLNAVRDVDAANLTMTVEAGCVLQSLQEAAEAAGFLFPLSLAAEGSCTIGGNLATNAGGTQVVRYGNARELCLGLEVVTAQGEIWNGLSGLRKDNTGYDLRDLFIGSEGTLGVITAATMKLYPLPAATLTAWAAVPSLEDAVRLLGLAHKHLGAGPDRLRGDGPVRARAWWRGTSRRCACPCTSRRPYCVLLENSDHESELHARGAVRALAGNRAGRRLRDRCGGGGEPHPGAPALAHPRKHSAGPGRRRPEHQARHLHRRSRAFRSSAARPTRCWRGRSPACGW